MPEKYHRRFVIMGEWPWQTNQNWRILSQKPEPVKLAELAVNKVVPNKNGAFTSHTVEDWNAILEIFPPWHVVESKLLQTTTAMKISKPTPEENKI